jgi:hypothetical protein
MFRVILFVLLMIASPVNALDDKSDDNVGGSGWDVDCRRDRITKIFTRDDSLARLRRVAGCATPTGSACHAGATVNLKLTFHLDHSAGADQRRNRRAR